MRFSILRQAIFTSSVKASSIKGETLPTFSGWMHWSMRPPQRKAVHSLCAGNSDSENGSRYEKLLESRSAVAHVPILYPQMRHDVREPLLREEMRHQGLRQRGAAAAPVTNEHQTLGLPLSIVMAPVRNVFSGRCGKPVRHREIGSASCRRAVRQ